MARTTIDRLIVNSPYEEPARHWRYDRETCTFDLVEGRRPAGYVVATPGSKSFDDPGIFVEIPLVNQIRPCVKAWREAGYPGVSSITKRLLEHCRDPEEFGDAKTVTHIMGLRAFTSQLLCEQVVGRGLRRTSYEVNPETGLFEPEYVNIFGVPFTFLPHEGGEDGPPPPPMPKTAIEPDPAKAEFEIRGPNVVRIEHVFQPVLTLDWGLQS